MMTMERGEIGLTEGGRAAVEEVARRHGVGTDAVLVLLRALERGGGEQAQFSHPDLGGMGQWSRHGMIMVGDMFNTGLKARVDQLCSEVADLLGKGGVLAAGSRGGAGGWSAGAWWPEQCGTPSSSGSQNDLRYAFFPQTRRLAIGRGDRVDLYDTGEHRIHGVSQQQGAGQDLRFESQLGTIALHELPRVGGEETAHRAEAAPAEPAGQGSWQSQSQGVRREMPRREPRPEPALQESREPVPPAPAPAGDDVFAKIERLHELQRKGILNEAEFAEKKKELLARI